MATDLKEYKLRPRTRRAVLIAKPGSYDIDGNSVNFDESDVGYYAFLSVDPCDDSTVNVLLESAARFEREWELVED